MFESFKFNSTPSMEKPENESTENKEIVLDYEEIKKNQELIRKRNLETSTKKQLEDLAKEVEVQEGVEKAKKTLEEEFKHRS